MSDDIYTRQGFAQPLGFGEKTGLLIIDWQVGYTREDGLGGYNCNEAIANTAVLLGAARAAGIPIAHVRFTTQEGAVGLGPFGKKVPKLCALTPDHPDAQFVESVAPAPGEYVSQKRHGSAFFGTTLAAWLLSERVDSLMITGCTTSGCVRASVVDASAHGLLPIVVEDCVGDRAEGPHLANLFDMRQKYADVISLQTALAHLGQTAAGAA